jgi:3-dehydroquinate synthase
MDEMQLIVTGYALNIARGALDRVGTITLGTAPAHRYAIITDDATGPLYAGRVAAELPADRTMHLQFAAGEASKTRETWAALTDELLEAGCGRDTTIIALGGGVTGDLAGFVAATFLRGVPYVQVPTTLLAMIDSSIGGKTAVDTVHGKNLVGAFHRPSAVVTDPELLLTLPGPHLRAGLAEALKHALIADATLFDWIELHSAELLDEPGGTHMTELIARAVAIKARVVEADERESGMRKTLNLGHTVGHAIEQVSGYSLLHGEAVAIGMVVETRAAEAVGIAEPGTCERLMAALERLELPTRVPSDLQPDRILAATRTDKKAREGLVAYALPCRIGEMAGAAQHYGIPLEDSVVRTALEAGRA